MKYRCHVRFLALFLALLLFIPVLSGCNKGPQSVVIGTSFDVNGYRPWSPFVNPYTNGLHLLIYDALFTLDEYGFVEPSIVREYEQDDLVYTLTLHEGAKFHNGAELTSADVADTLLRLIYVHATRSPETLQKFEKLEKIELVSKYQMKFHLNAPDMMFLQALTFGITPAYNPNKVTEDPWPREIERKSLQLVYLSVNQNQQTADVIEAAYSKTLPIGSGPWKIDEKSYNNFIHVNSPVKLELSRNDQYWKGNVAIEKITLQQLKNGPYEINGYLLSKAMDISPWTSSLWGDLSQMEYFSKFKSAEHLNLIQYLPSTTSQRLHFSKINGTESEHLVRQAIAYAIDREALLLAQTEQDGSTGVVTQQYLTPEHPWYFELKNPYEYNEEKAKELLAEAEYDKSIVITATSLTNDLDQWLKTPVAKELNRQLNEVGIELTWVPVYEAREAKAMQLQTIPMFDPNSLYANMTSPNRQQLEYFNEDSAFVQSLEEMMSSTDVEIQKQKYQEALQEIHDQAYTVPLINEYHYYAYNNRIQGLELTNPNQIFVDLWQATLK